MVAERFVSHCRSRCGMSSTHPLSWYSSHTSVSESKALRTATVSDITIHMLHYDSLCIVDASEMGFDILACGACILFPR